MIRKVLVAGATGYLGRHLVQVLQRRGIWVRALVRHPERAVGLEVDDVFQGEVTTASSLTGAARTVDAVLSTVGITRQREGYTYDDVDYAGNVNLLQLAEAEGTKAFMYVSLFRGQELRGFQIAAAKERFVGRLRASTLQTLVIRPTAFFSDMAEVLRMAHMGRVFVFGDGSTLVNPISGRDLAEASVDALLAGQSELKIGGPQVFTHEETAELAFDTLRKPPRVWHMPLWTASSLW